MNSVCHRLLSVPCVRARGRSRCRSRCSVAIQAPVLRMKQQGMLWRCGALLNSMWKYKAGCGVPGGAAQYEVPWSMVTACILWLPDHIGYSNQVFLHSRLSLLGNYFYSRIKVCLAVPHCLLNWGLPQ
jgi:hypothetical protein